MLTAFIRKRKIALHFEDVYNQNTIPGYLKGKITKNKKYISLRSRRIILCKTQGKQTAQTFNCILPTA
ncbi:MAG: hypothetical protein B6D64_11070 [Bacteroidetes bacterium 4484_276]|nr:MAG: hypothetical protein B6D64_11070 [Bacteroidetes bacterium 4484_276]